MAWEPILVGDLATTARDVVIELGKGIEDPTLAQYPSARTLFWAYVGGAFDDETTTRHYDAATDALLTDVADHLGAPVTNTALYGGLAGAGWVLSHISDGEAPLLDDLDQILLDALTIHPSRGSYDLISGLVGHAVYFLERTLVGAAAGARGLAEIVRLLELRVWRDDHGATWYTDVDLLPPHQATDAPAGYFNCGVAHGLPGAISVLARIAASPAADSMTAARARALADDATRWLRAQRLPPNPLGRFPPWVVPGKQPRQARTAWCYGDIGIATSMWAAATHLGTPIEEWRQLATEARDRPFEMCRADDPGMCHGAVGIGHLFNRCYQASRDETFRTVAVRWFERALAMRQPGQGIAGFFANHQVQDRTVPDAPDTRQDFLEGAAGIGLALLAALGGEEPGWDRLLTCDVAVATTSRDVGTLSA